MSESSPHGAGEIRAVPEHERAPGTPLWVRVSAVIALVLVLLVVVLLLIGGGHGPGRHAGADGGAQRTPSADVELRPTSSAGPPSERRSGSRAGLSEP